MPVGSILGAASSLFGNFVNQRENQINRQFNQQMMDKQMQFEEDMWEKENEYNLPSNWRKRIEDADLNAAILAAGGNGLGQATNSPKGTAASATGSIPFQSPMFSGGLPLIESLIGIKSSMTQQRSLDEDVTRKKIENEYLAQKLEWDLANSREDYRGKNLANNLSDATYDAEVRRRRSEAAIVEAEESRQEFYSSMAALDVNQKRMLQSWIPDMLNIQFDLLKSKKRLTDKQADKLIEEKFLISEQRKKLVNENKLFRETYEAYKNYLIAQYHFFNDYYAGTWNGEPRGLVKFRNDIQGSRYPGQIGNTIYSVGNAFDDFSYFLKSLYQDVRSWF